MGIAYYFSRWTHTAAKHLTDRSTCHDIYLNCSSSFCLLVKVQRSISVGSPFSCFSIFCTSIDRVWSLVTATIDFTDDKRFTSVLIDVDRNRAHDVTTLVVTTKDTSELAAGHSQCDITFNDSFLGTTIDDLHKFIRQTFQGDVHIALDVSMAAGTIDFTDIQVCTAVAGYNFTLLFCADVCAATDITLGVTAAIDIVDITAKEFCHSLTCAIVGRCLTVFVDTNVCSGVAITRTITAAIQRVDDV